jgi:hypothetical protein
LDIPITKVGGAVTRCDAMDKTKLAYVCGLFDGEGSIVSYKGCIQLYVQNTDLRLLRRIHEIFGGHIGIVNRGNELKGHQALFAWALKKREDVFETLLLMSEFLIGKKEEAELAIAMMETFSSSENLQRLRDLKREKLALSLKELGLSSIDELAHTIESAGPKTGHFSVESRIARRNLTGVAWQEKYGNRKMRSDSRPKISDEEDIFGGN